jgi:hypothetical protein
MELMTVPFCENASVPNSWERWAGIFHERRRISLKVPLVWNRKLRFVEPISPELVLIDPELARLEQARLAATADVRPAHRTLDPLREAQDLQFRWRGRAQRVVDFVTGAAWAGVVVGIFLFIEGLHR